MFYCAYRPPDSLTHFVGICYEVKWRGQGEVDRSICVALGAAAEEDLPVNKERERIKGRVNYTEK